ncbi:MAG: hypothetical protein AAF243_14805 [Cyanobacteria bacterium P01_A01_bin.137]
MPSSSRPYQSKVLKFVLQQWQQGIERQDRAWRQLQSASVWGAQVAIFPIYAVMRAVKRASFALDSGSSTQQNQPAEPITAAKGNVTDIDHSLTAILSHTQQLLSSEQATQLTVTPKRSLVRKVQSLLSTIVRQIWQQPIANLPSARHATAITKSRRRAVGITTAHQIQQQSESLTTARSAGIYRKVTSGLIHNGITLASSLDTHQLVLVSSGNEIFDIFTAEQQADLKHYISCVMNAYWQSRSITPQQPKQLSVKTILAIGTVFIAALPMEFKKAWSQITPAPSGPSLPPLTSEPQPRSRVFYPHSSTSDTIKAHVRRLPNKPINPRRLTSNAPDAFEANVNDIKYLEHPLEGILRWIDRVLTWCENRWQRWLDHRANIG